MVISADVLESYAKLIEASNKSEQAKADAAKALAAQQAQADAARVQAEAQAKVEAAKLQEEQQRRDAEQATLNAQLALIRGGLPSATPDGSTANAGGPVNGGGVVNRGAVNGGGVVAGNQLPGTAPANGWNNGDDVAVLGAEQRRPRHKGFFGAIGHGIKEVFVGGPDYYAGRRPNGPL